jgi:hypothetical protein
VRTAFEAGRDGVSLRILEASTLAGDAMVTTKGAGKLDEARRRT